jgi:hypothetical protein
VYLFRFAHKQKLYKNNFYDRLQALPPSGFKSKVENDSKEATPRTSASSKGIRTTYEKIYDGINYYLS